MRTIKRTVYTFDELNDEAKEKAIKGFRETSHMEFEFEKESILDYWKHKLETIGFNDADIVFCGFYSQGDGASFTSDIDPIKVINNLIMCNRLNYDQSILFNKILKMEEKQIIELNFGIRRIQTRYCHENTITVDSNCEFLGKLIEPQYGDKALDFFNAVFENIREEIEDYVKEICQTIFYELRTLYDYLNSDEYIEDFIINNEYEFYSNGELYIG